MVNDMFSLKDKIVLITGASEGIGAALAKAMASAGASLILCSRSLEKLRKVNDEIRDEGGKTEIYQLDVTDYTSIINLKNLIESRYKKIDVLINNAGYAVTKPTVDISEQDFDLMCDTGFKGLFFCCQQFFLLMKEQRYGKIINLSSTFSKTTAPGRSVYAGIKAGVSHLTEALAVEWAEFGICVNAIAPTAVMTPTRQKTVNKEIMEQVLQRIPMGRVATTDDLVGTAIYLASSASDFVTGQTIFVDGGWTAK
ncbi:MAG: SDR family oxidoreductase [Alicyclobacillus sp.]|nr:SDR family oxidoreductase [Alicyclobacillus sp.]